MLAFLITINFFIYVMIVIGNEKNELNPDESTQSIPRVREIRQRHTAEEIEYIKIRIMEETQVQGRITINRNGAFWDNGIVPYVFSNRYTERDKELLLDAMNEFHVKTCIRFTPRENEMSYVIIEPGEGCFALIGRLENEVNRVLLPEVCLDKGTIIHELMHVLGFLHEQNRPDRDEYVRIMYNNIMEDKAANFDKFSFEDINTAEQSYDYSSIMHYGPLEFSKDGRSPTIVPLQRGVVIGQRATFSENDILKINYFYQC